MVNQLLRWPLFLSVMLVSWNIAAASIEVTINEAKLIQLPEKAKSIFISSVHIADYQALTNTKIMVFGKEAGSATITVLNEDEKIILNQKIRVTHNTKELEALVSQQFPEAMVSAESLGGKLWLKGQVPTPIMAHKIVSLAKGYLSPVVAKQSNNSNTDTTNKDDSNNVSSTQSVAPEDELVNQLSVNMPNQVNIRVRIAEVSKNVSNKLGIQWGSLEKGVGQFLIGDLPEASNISGLVDALASNGMMSVLAEPNLTAMSGESATFLVGGEVPLPLIQGDTATVEYKPFGVSLNFTPVVLSPNRISLKVEPEVSNISVSGQAVVGENTYPSISTRRASTTIELASGQSFTLGGLLQTKEVDQLKKVPFIGEIPVLGALFRSTEFTREETELVIIATAYLVKPTRGDDLPLPTDGLIPQSDLERLLVWRDEPKRTPKDKKTYTDNHQPRLLGDNGFYY